MIEGAYRIIRQREDGLWYLVDPEDIAEVTDQGKTLDEWIYPEGKPEKRRATSMPFS